MKTKLRGSLILLIFFTTASVFSLEFTLRPRVYALFPLGDKTTGRFDTGFGTDILFDLDFSTIITNPLGIGYSAGIEGGLAFAPLISGRSDSISMLSGGFGLGVYYYPVSRLNLRLDGALGLFQGTLSGDTADAPSESSLWWRIGGEAGFRLTPKITLSALGGYRQYRNRFSGTTGNSFFSGLYTGLVVQFNFETPSSTRGIDLRLAQDEPVYPLYHSLYRDNPAGTLTLTNHEGGEIRNVRVSFRAGRYTSSEYACGTIALLARGRSVEIPLLADFSRAVMGFTEDGRILGEAVVRYSFLGAERTVVLDAPIGAYNRNSFRWVDPAGLAAFISPQAPETLEFSKQISGLSRSYQHTGINRNLQTGIWLFDGLRAAGIGYGGPLGTPYGAYHRNPGVIDEIQYPFQTLGFRTGDIDDLGLLFAASLEAAGIPSAFIPLTDEFIVAWSLEISPAQAASQFNDTGRILTVNDKVWVPVALSAFNDGFSAAWDKAAEYLLQTVSSSEPLSFIVTADAWTIYPPAASPEQAVRFTRPDENNVITAAERDIKLYIEKELIPKITALRGAGTGTQLNQLGLLYLRTGSLSQARTAFTQAANLGFLSAMINLGNLAIQDESWDDAERWYKQVLDKDPENGAAKRGLERASAGRN
jgi:tetratricopeptide (TPR) repeat protein